MFLTPTLIQELFQPRLELATFSISQPQPGLQSQATGWLDQVIVSFSEYGHCIIALQHLASGFRHYYWLASFDTFSELYY